MMIQFRFLLVVLTYAILPQFMKAQEASMEWLRISGGASSYNGSRSVVLDQYGSVYSSGFFSGSIDFDPGEGTTVLTSESNTDAFVQKLDNDGNFIWVKQTKCTSSITNRSIAIDEMGNTYTTGYFSGTATFNPGPEEIELTSAGMSDFFVQKLSVDGAFMWVKKFGGEDEDVGWSIVSDLEGNTVLTGNFSGMVDFNPNTGVFNLSAVGTRDGFVLKLNSDGEFLWAVQLTGTYVVGHAISLDAAGNVYSAGRFTDSLNFNLGSGVENLTAFGEADIYIQKLDTNGNFVWAKGVGGSGSDLVRSISVSPIGNILITGLFQNTVDFDPGAETVEFTSAGGHDIFIQKLNSDGDFIWLRQMGGIATDFSAFIYTDELENVYISGGFQGSVDFDPGEGEVFLNTVENPEGMGFIQKLDSNGNFSWVKRFAGTGGGSNNAALALAMDMDTSGNLFLAGAFGGSVDFIPGSGTEIHTTMGENAIFSAKYTECTLSDFVPLEPNLPIVNSGCPVTLQAPAAFNGCDTYLGMPSIDFPITNIGTTAIVWTYQGDFGNGLTQSQDVIITPDITSPIPDLSILPQINAVCEISMEELFIPTATDNCSGTLDAFPNVNFPITDLSITEIIWTYDDENGNTVTQNQSINWTSLDVTTDVIGNTITANNTAASYQWLDCDNDNAPIPDETNQSFTPTSSGNFAVEITEDGCTAVSECVVITTVGINDFELDLQLNVYPNPSSGIFYIEFEKVIGQAVVTITDVNGKHVSASQVQNTDRTSVEINEAPGVYLLSIRTNQGQKTVSLIKQ